MTGEDAMVAQRPPWQIIRVLLLIAALGGAVTIGTVAARQPLIALGAILAVPLVVAILVLPAVSTLAVIFIIYTNAAVVAVRFHGLPFVVGAASPVLLAIPLATYLIIRRQKPIITPVLPLIFLFLVIQVIATLFSGNIDVGVASLTPSVIEGFGLYFLLTNVVRTPELLRRVIWALLISGAFLGGLSLYQQITHTYNNDYWGFAQMSNAAFGTGVENIYGEVEQRRLAGPIGDQNFYAQVMLMLVPLGLFRFWGERSKVLRVLAVIATALIAVGAALTFSRGAAVGFVLMLVIMVFMRYIKLYQIAIILLGLILLMQVVPQYGARLSTLEVLSDAVATDGGSGIKGADSATQSRATEMLSALLVFADHPLFGVGPGMYRYYYHTYAQVVSIRMIATDRQAHSLYLDLAAETGALGLIDFLAILFVTLRNLALTRQHYIKNRPEFANMATGFMLAIVTYMTTALFLNLAYERYFWLMMALAGAMSYIASTSPSAEKEPTRKSAETAT